MLNRRQFIASLAVMIGAPRVLAESSHVRSLYLPLSMSFDQEIPTVTKICAIGDLQQTNTAERLFLSRDENEHARKMVIEGVAKDKPDVILLLGDQVSEGASDEAWEYFDGVMKPITDLGIPIIAVMGNHDYDPMDNRKAVRNSHKHFASCAKRPGVFRLGTLGLVTFDSNFDQFSAAEAKGQAERFAKALDELDNDPSIRGVLVTCHHPPYTNSALGINDAVANSFAKPFLARRKTRLFMSGHVHSYERFASGDKMFVVSGGGGGPRRMIDVSRANPYADQYRGGSLRPFNYLRLTVKEEGIDGEVLMVGKKKLRVGDTFHVGLYEPMSTSR